MRILALDPGPEKTGWVFYGDGRVQLAGVSPNGEMLEWLNGILTPPIRHPYPQQLAIEMIDSQGMPVGKEVFATCVWIGRYIQAWPRPDEVRLIYRRDVKLELCGSSRAKDSNVRQALIDRVGPRGTKKTPGPTYGVSGHAWAALGVAVR